MRVYGRRQSGSGQTCMGGDEVAPLSFALSRTDSRSPLRSRLLRPFVMIIPWLRFGCICEDDDVVVPLPVTEDMSNTIVVLSTRVADVATALLELET